MQAGIRRNGLKTVSLIIKEHITYRKQIIKLAKSDLIKTYRGSALGWAWAIIKPLVTIFVFWFAFSLGLRHGQPVDGYPFILWLIAGFLPWFYMSEMIPQGAACLRKNKHMVTKMKFPVSTIPTFTGLSKLVVHLVLLGIVIVIFCLFGFLPDIYYLQLPVYILMMLVFFVCWSLFAGMLSALSKDFQNLVNAFVTALFWLSGIIYNVNDITHEWIRILLNFNPITIMANGYRHVFIDKTWFFEDTLGFGGYFVVLFVMACMALWAYKKLYKEIPDVL